MIPRIPVSAAALPTDATDTGSGLPLRLDTTPAGDSRQATGHGADRGTLDGAWWPHSCNLTAELPSLIAGLNASPAAPDHGPYVTRISVNLTIWDAVPAHLDHAGRRVQLSWFGAIDAHTLSATRSDDSSLDLLVIPPQATTEQAHAATATATDPANTLHGAAILARHMPDLLRGPDTARSWTGNTGPAGPEPTTPRSQTR